MSADEFRAALVVSKVQVLAEDVLGVTLVDPEGGSLPSWTPGAHIDVELPNGLLRQYSVLPVR